MAGRNLRGAEAGFTLLELIFVMLIVGTLATVGLSAYGSYRDRTWKMEANAVWHELSMAVNIYRIDKGYWPEPYTHADGLFFAMDTDHVEALGTNLAPRDFEDEDRRIRERMEGAPGKGGPDWDQPDGLRTGHLILAAQGLDDLEICVWVKGIAADGNSDNCPRKPE